MAQLAEQLICNQQVNGSSPFIGLYGWIPEWPKGTDCKSAANCFGGSNPPPSIFNNNFITRGGAVWKLVGLITRRSQVQILSPLLNAQIAQLVEQRTENPRVTGSIPVLGIFFSICLLLKYGPLAQVVEHLTFNQVVWGSNPQWLIKKIKKWKWGFEPLLISPVAH